ncbi:MAG: hypothetical protein Q4F67_00260 [Propionibacteriaceae bacterium]|nr:hypothetical protein [Propionibacteriaceae bacterium]
MDTHNTQLEFSLPSDAWEPAEPPEGTLFLIQRRGDFDRFRPNITASIAELRPEALITDAADALANRLRRFDDDVRVVNREQSTDDDPTVIQLLAFTVAIDNASVELAQFQTLVEMQEINGPRRWALCLAMTSEADRIMGYAEDYQALLTSVRPATG